MSEKKDAYKGLLPGVGDLDYNPMVFSKYQEFKSSGFAVRFELTAAFRIGCFQLVWQMLKSDQEGYHQARSVKLWLKADQFVSTLEQIRNKRIAPVVGSYVDKRGVEVKTYYENMFMGSVGKNGGAAESRGFRINDASGEKYLYAFTGRRVDGVASANGTIKPQTGATPTQLQICFTREEIWEMSEAARRMWHGYTAAQWSRTVIREELQQIFSEYSKFATASVSATQQAPQIQEEVVPPTVEEPVEAPQPSPVQEHVSQNPEPVVEQQDGVIDYDDLPY